jgi:hypothetical protein
VAKTFRNRPLLKVDDGAGLPIQRQRAEWATRKLGEYVARFDGDFIIEVATEIGLDETMNYTEDGEGLDFDMTELQIVALCSALAACAEFRDGREDARPRRKRRG